MSGFSLTITRLSQPAGGHATKAYGRGVVESYFQEETPENDGFVYLDHENGWLTVRHCPFRQGLPRNGGQTVYRSYEERSVFSASPEELDDILPEYIEVPDEYERFDIEEDKAFHAMWHGTVFERQPRDEPAEVAVNPTKLFVSDEIPEVSDEEWRQIESWDALVEAAEDGYESERRVRQIVGDEYYDASVSGDNSRYKLV